MSIINVSGYPGYAFLICLFLFSLCISFVSAENLTDEKKEITITDMLGRSVLVRVPVERIILDDFYDFQNVVEIDKTQYQTKIAGWSSDVWYSNNSILLIMQDKFPGTALIPDVGSWDKGTVNYDKIVSLVPDIVIFPSWKKDLCPEVINKMQETGIPVVFTDYELDAYPGRKTFNSIQIIGQILGMENEAKGAIDNLKNQIATNSLKVSTCYADPNGVTCEDNT